MTMKLRHHFGLKRLRGSRALSWMLLAFILFGSTVEAAHSHGNLLANSATNYSAQFSDPADQGKLNTSSTGCGECLICQLQHNFQATVISAPASIAPVVQTSLFVTPQAFAFGSRSVVTRIGRAPPESSC